MEIEDQNMTSLKNVCALGPLKSPEAPRDKPIQAGSLKNLAVFYFTEQDVQRSVGLQRWLTGSPPPSLQTQFLSSPGSADFCQLCATLASSWEHSGSPGRPGQTRQCLKLE